MSVDMNMHVKSEAYEVDVKDYAADGGLAYTRLRIEHRPYDLLTNKKAVVGTEAFTLFVDDVSELMPIARAIAEANGFILAADYDELASRIFEEIQEESKP